jgi:excisionase family DNA binding protein
MTDKLVYLSVRQTADILSVSPRTIRRYIEQNILPAYRVTGSNTIRIKREDLEALLEPINASAQERSRLEAI